MSRRLQRIIYIIMYIPDLLRRSERILSDIKNYMGGFSFSKFFNQFKDDNMFTDNEA